MNHAEQYAETRIAMLTREIAGCLPPSTLDEIVEAIQEHSSRPILTDLLVFANRMTEQRATLTD